MLTNQEVNERVCEIVGDQLGIDRQEIHLRQRMIKDLNCDSLDIVELIMSLEEEFGFDFPDKAPDDPMYPRLFVNDPTIGDLAEYAYIHQGTVQHHRSPAKLFQQPRAIVAGEPFTQLSGVHVERTDTPAYEPFGANRFRRTRDGMLTVPIPAAEMGFIVDGVERRERLSAFLIDIEPVSTSAYARFLSAVVPTLEQLRSWFVLDESDGRRFNAVLEYVDGHWRPAAGTERWPMVLVSWYGAAAYAAWVHGRPLDVDIVTPVCLPTEWQWEYAARGAEPKAYPWGSDPATPERASFARHARGTRYPGPADMPIEPVNVPLGVSPFGLRHMAGNVWNWCSNAYGDNPDIRAERGGSWVGPASLCRSDYRRGRSASARGRCLGFRCAVPLSQIDPV